MQARRRSVADHDRLLKSRGLYGTICEGKVTERHAASPNKHHLFFWPRVSLRLVVLISRLSELPLLAHSSCYQGYIC